MSLKCACPTHDSVELSVSVYNRLLQNSQIPKGYWVAADDACDFDESIITHLPLEHASSRTAGDAFDFFQIFHPMHIGQSFSC